MSKEQNEYDIPRFCPLGCGETLIPTPLTVAEWEETKDIAKTFGCDYENCWFVICTKCSFKTRIMSRKLTTEEKEKFQKEEKNEP